jgi:hypothetical protein
LGSATLRARRHTSNASNASNDEPTLPSDQPNSVAKTNVVHSSHPTAGEEVTSVPKPPSFAAEDAKSSRVTKFDADDLLRGALLSEYTDVTNTPSADAAETDLNVVSRPPCIDSDDDL